MTFRVSSISGLASLLARQLPSLSAAIILLLATAEAFSAEFHVTTSGLDADDGSAAKPWKNIQQALDAAAAGDTVVVHAGTYQLAAPLVIKTKATAAAPLLVRAEGAVTVRDPARNFGEWSGVVRLDQATFVTLRGFRVENASFFGILLDHVDNVTVESCQTDGSLGSGIYTGDSTHITLRNNDVSHCCEGDINLVSSQECISVARSDGFELVGNAVHDSVRGETGGEGINIKEGTSNGSVHHNRISEGVRLGIYVEAWDKLTQNIEIYANEVFHNCNGIVIASERGGTVRNVRVHDNLVYENGLAYSPKSQYWPWGGGIGISIPGYLSNGPREAIALYNNTVVRNSDDKGYGIGISIDTDNLKSLLVRDNIVTDNPTAQIDLSRGAAETTVLSNLVFPYFGNSWMHEVRGEQPIETAPGFVDTKAFNFRLSATSPAVDVGSGGPELAASDWDGNARVAGSKVDLGAFEYGSQPAVATGGSGGTGTHPGTAGSGGLTASGGAASHAGIGNGTGAAAPGAAGLTASGGSATGQPTAAAQDSTSDGGCGCSLPTSARGTGWMALLGLLGLMLVRRGHSR